MNGQITQFPLGPDRSSEQSGLASSSSSMEVSATRAAQRHRKQEDVVLSAVDGGHVSRHGLRRLTHHLVADPALNLCPYDRTRES